MFLQADAKRLQDIIDSLIHNAVSYTTEGFISLHFQAVEKGVEFFIRDTGRGIHPEDIPKLFNRFESIGANRDVQVGMGAGLGLAIARDLVFLHGGDINIESTLGEGTCVYLFMPFQPLE